MARTSAHFDDYISEIYGTQERDTFGALAARNELRRDTYPAMSFGKPPNQDFVPRSKRTAAARRSVGIRDAGPGERRQVEGGGDELEALRLKLKIMELEKSKGKEEMQSVQAEDDEDGDW